MRVSVAGAFGLSLLPPPQADRQTMTAGSKVFFIVRKILLPLQNSTQKIDLFLGVIIVYRGPEDGHQVFLVHIQQGRAGLTNGYVDLPCRQLLLYPGAILSVHRKRDDAAEQVSMVM